MVVSVLSVDIGTLHFTAVAATLSTDTELPHSIPGPDTGSCKFKSFDIVDVFTVNLGAGVKGLRNVDNLVAAWDNLTLFQCFKPDVVLIENQLKQATVNYFLSIATYTLAKRSFPQCSVRFIRPLTKFAGFLRFFPSPRLSYSLRSYQQRKAAAVTLSDCLLQTYCAGASLGSICRLEADHASPAKLDDAADAFLQLFCL
jgi:hypothetical protein